MVKKCPVCQVEYDNGGNSWKKKCYDCYTNYKHATRIKKLRHKENVYVTHPSVTKEELDQWIIDNKEERGWGVQEMKIENYAKRYRIYFDSTNFD